MTDACSSYRQDNRICRDGFIQTYGCWKANVCFSCGKPSETVPYCLRDELPEHWLTEDGRSIFLPVGKPDLWRAGQNTEGD